MNQVHSINWTMPRVSEKRRILGGLERDIKALIEVAIVDVKESIAWRAAEELLEVYHILSIPRYVSLRQNSPLDHHTLDRLIYEHSERTFLAMFRAKKRSFWMLVERLTGYWEKLKEVEFGRGKQCRPIYQQLAVGLFMLGCEGGGVERLRTPFGIGHGTMIVYLWRTIHALQPLISEVIR